MVSEVRNCFRRARRQKLAAIGLVYALLSFSTAYGPASAGVLIEGDDQSEIEIIIEQEPLAVTIETLAAKFDIVIEGIVHTAKAEPVTASIQGSVKDVLARLLKNWNHAIVLDADDPTRVEKIIILNDAQGSRPPAPTAPAPSTPDVP